MNINLQTELIRKYPKIFQQVGMTPQQSCMAFGIECGDGWYWLIDNLCGYLQNMTDGNRHRNWPQVVAVQVKEKFGGLRFYTEGGNDDTEGAIAFAEALSYEICENCGSIEYVQQTQGWIQTLCQECRKE